MIFGKSRNDAGRPVEAETIQRWRDIAGRGVGDSQQGVAVKTSPVFEAPISLSPSDEMKADGSEQVSEARVAPKSTPKWTEELRESMRLGQPSAARSLGGSTLRSSLSGSSLAGSSPAGGSHSSPTPGASKPGAKKAKEYGEVRSALGPGTMIEGKLSFDSPVRIDGTLRGEVTSSSLLIVGEQAVINAVVNVGSLVVHGQVSGAVRAQEFVEIRDGGVLEANINAGRLIIEEGGFFRGACNK